MQSRTHWPVTLPLAILLSAALIFAAMQALKEKPKHKDDTNKVPLVSAQHLELGSRDLKVRSQGIFKSQYETTLVAQVSGELIGLAPEFERGGIVKKGSLLAQIDPFNYEVQLEDARAQLASARAALVLEEAQAAVAKAEWEKISDTEPTALSLRKPQLEQAKARVKAAEAGVKQAAKNLERTRIVSPFDALVSNREVSLGTFVTMGAKLGHVLDVSRGEIRLPIPGKDITYLENEGVGAEVELSSEFEGQKEIWQARIARTEGLIDESSRMVYLVAEVIDPYGVHKDSRKTLPFGSYVIAQIKGKHLENVAMVPRHLIDDNKVPIFKDGKLVYKEVEVLRIEGSMAVVTNGVSDEDQLIVSSLQYPIEGMDLELIGAEKEELKTEKVVAQEKDSIDQEGDTM